MAFRQLAFLKQCSEMVDRFNPCRKYLKGIWRVSPTINPYCPFAIRQLCGMIKRITLHLKNAKGVL